MLSTEDKTNSNFKLCDCGCNEQIPIKDKKGRPRSYKMGHWINNHINLTQKLDNHPNWKNGIIKSSHGYTKIKINKRDYEYQHRLIYEHYLSILFDKDIKIPDGYEVHHIKPVKEGGTNALINLELLNRKDHKLKHRKDKSNRICLLCGSNKTYVDKKHNREQWRKYNNGFICMKCHRKHISYLYQE